MSRYATVQAVTAADEEPERSSWMPVDLTDALNNTDVPAPSILTRTDGCALLYPGRTHSFSGEPESCKSWAAVLACVQVLERGGRCLWVDYEDDDRGIVGRLRALGASDDAIVNGFVYLRPEEPLQTRDGRATAGEVDFAALITSTPFDLAIVDGVTEAMTTEGLDLMSNADVAVWMRRVPKRIANTTGAAVVVVDHLVKNREAQGRFAIGGQHKLAGLTGAAYKFEVRRPLARAIHDPVEGAVTVTVMKDRPGFVRGRAINGNVGVLELTSWPDGTLSAAIVPPGEAKGPDLHLVVERSPSTSTTTRAAPFEGPKKA